MAFKATASRTATSSRAIAAAQNDEYEGLWINVGIDSEDENSEDGTKFNRLPRGIAVSDLKDHKIYPSSNEDWAAEAQLVNSIMDLIRERGLELEEGESIPLNLSVHLYRRQEQVEKVASKKDTTGLKNALFG